MSTKAHTTPVHASSDSQIRIRMLWAVIAAVAAAVASWAVIGVLAGVDLRAPVFDGRTGSQDIGPTLVGANSLIAALAAWALLALLERYTVRSRRIWTIIALAGLVLSLGGPLSGTGIDAANRIFLLALHVVVAVVLIPLLYRTAREPGSEVGR